MTDRRDQKFKRLACRWNSYAVSNRHRISERAFKDARDCSPFPGGNSYRMLLNARVRRKNEQRLQILDVYVNACSCPAIGPMDDHILGVALPELIPFLTCEDVEIKIIKCLKVCLLSLLPLCNFCQLTIIRTTRKQCQNSCCEKS